MYTIFPTFLIVKYGTRARETQAGARAAHSPLYQCARARGRPNPFRSMASKLLVLFFVCALAQYSVEILEKGAEPALSIGKPAGQGYSPCKFTFNPAWIPAGPGLNASILIVRASGCPDSFGGGSDHLLYAFCRIDDNGRGVCNDLLPYAFPFETEAEDPRVFLLEENGELWYYLYYFASGPGQQTVYLRKTTTPLNLSSWQLVAKQLPWHRNGCVVVRASGDHYVMFGESPPLPGLGIATTTDFSTYNYVNLTYMTPNGPNNTAEPEIVIEAGSTPIQLSTGDYLHLYAAGTPGWVANGNYTGGWIIMVRRLRGPPPALLPPTQPTTHHPRFPAQDRDDPSILKQRSETHLFVPTMDYEIGGGKWPTNRFRTIFTTAVVPLPNEGADTFLVWYGAADANVAWAKIRVTHS